MMKRLCSIFLVLVMVLSLLVGCGKGSDDADAGKETGTKSENNVLNISVSASVSATACDPLNSDSLATDQILHVIGDTLVRYSPDGSTFLPGIAESWDISEDCTVYTFHLRDDVYFQPGEYQDGRKVTAEDMAYSLERAKGYWCNYLYMLDLVEATDEHTLVCHLNAPTATFLAEVAHSTTIAVPREECEGWGDEFGSHVVSTGAYQMAEHIANQQTKLVKNENYWDGEPRFDEVNFITIADSQQELNALLTGEIDLSTNISGEGIDMVKDASNLEYLQVPYNRISLAGFNMNSEYLSDVRVRKALCMAVNYDDLCSGTYQNGEATVSKLPLPSTSWGYDESLESLVPDYDVDAAKELMKEAGYEDGFTLTLVCQNSDAMVRIATLLQEFWKELNVDVVINQTQRAVLMESLQNGSFDVFVNSQNGSSDPATFVGYFYSSDKLNTNYNAWGYSNPEVDEMLAQAMQESDQAVRADIYKEVMETTVPECVGIFFATESLRWGVNTSVKGLAQQESTTSIRLCGAGFDVSKE